jgi:hypothetical protein
VEIQLLSSPSSLLSKGGSFSERHHPSVYR